MPIQILMPALSPTMTEGNLVKWLKKEGDTVEPGQVIAEIETDKATMEVEAVDEGIIGKIIIPEGTEGVQVNALIALLLEEGEDASALEGMSTSTAPANGAGPEKAHSIGISDSSTSVAAPVAALHIPQVHASETTGGRVFATPLARRIAQDKNINLAQVKGSGPRGRIIKADLENVSASSVPMQNVGLVGGSMEPEYVDLPVSGMRKVIAKRLTESKQTIPHFYLTIECNIDALLALRQKINEKGDHKVSVNDFVARACAVALIKVPEANTMWAETTIRQYKTVGLNVAVSIDGGLVTPVVQHAHRKSLVQISQEIKALAEKARAGKLTPEDYQGGTFTLSNLGMFGISQFEAIINPPQACILAVGMGQKKPVVINDQIQIATMMNCTLSTDHRAVDGAVGAQFLKVFKELIEDPIRLLI